MIDSGKKEDGLFGHIMLTVPPQNKELPKIDFNFDTIEMDNNAYPIMNVGVYAVCYLDANQYHKDRFMGLNMLIVLDGKYGEKIKKTFKEHNNLFMSYLVDNNNDLRVPCEIHTGNDKTKYENYDRETIALFGYINPLMFKGGN